MCEIMEKIREEAINEGINKGISKGEARVNRLNSILIDMDRLEDMKRAARDKDFQMELMLELLPKEM